jgi:DNA-binding XRE family transcriptional regulator
MEIDTRPRRRGERRKGRLQSRDGGQSAFPFLGAVSINRLHQPVNEKQIRVLFGRTTQLANRRLLVLVRKALTECGLTRAQLARDSQVSQAALWAWWKGSRTPSGDSLKKLAAGLRARSTELDRIADQLERAAE